MADWRPALRLGIAPVLLLAWNFHVGAPLTFLGPSLLVTLLATSPARPPLKLLVGMMVLVAAITTALALGFVSLAESPFSVWLALMALATGCFARLAGNPADVPARLALLTAAIVTALIQAEPILALALPWLMCVAVLQAALCALLAHALLPSPPSAAAPPPRREIAPQRALRAVCKALALVLLLSASVAMEDLSAVLVATTCANVLLDPEDDAARAQGRTLMLANLAAAALTLPVLAVAIHRQEVLLLLPLALAGALFLARGLGGSGTARTLAVVGLPVFVVLLGLLVPKAGDSALLALTDRLVTLSLVVLYALAVLALLRTRAAPAPRPA